MRILQLPNLYFPSIGGVQKLVQTLSEGLVLEGDDVSVLTSNLIDGDQLKKRYYVRGRSAEHSVDFEIINGVKVHRFPVNDKLHQLLYYLPEKWLPHALHERWMARKHGYRFFRKQPFCPAILGRLIRFKADIAVASNSASPFGYYCYLAKRLVGLPYVMHPSLHVEADWAREPVTAQVLQQADAVIAQTDFEKRHLVRMGVDPRRIAVIGAGIDDLGRKTAGRLPPNALQGAGSYLKVLFLGRMVAGKGIEQLIAAMPLVWRQHPDIRLVLAGTAEADFQPCLERALSGLSNRERDRVLFIEGFDDKEKDSIYRCCDMFAMPSKADSFGIAFLEAWARRLPVIALQNTAPASFIRHRQDGWLVEPGSIAALAAAIVNLANSQTLRRSLGDKGYARAGAEFSTRRFIRRTRLTYLDVLGGCVPRDDPG